MCNPAEQSGVDYASDAKRINGFVSETDHLLISASTNAGTVIERNEASDHRSNDTSELSGGKVHNSGQEMQTPNVYVQESTETSEHSFNSNVVNFKDDAHPSFAEDRTIETMSMDQKTLIEDTLSDTTSKWIEEVNFEKEALQPIRKGTTSESDTLAGISKEFPEQASSEVVEIPNSTLVSCVNELDVKGTEELKIESCKNAEETEMRMIMHHAGDNTTLLVGLVGGSVDHSKEPCAETDDARFGNISSLTVVVPEVEQVERYPQQMENSLKRDPASLEETSSPKGPVPMDFEEPVTWIEMRTGTIEGVAEQLARNSEEAPSVVMQTGMYCEESENAFKRIDAGSLDTQDTAEKIELTDEKTGKVIKEIDEDLNKSIHGTAMSSKEAAAEQATISLEELVVKQGVVFDETQREIQQEGSIVSPVQVAAATDNSVSKGINGPELAEFFKNARSSNLEKEIEEQDRVPIMVKLPPKKKTFMESPRSLRMLLFSDETTLPLEKDEKHKKNGKGIEFSSKAALAAESNGNKNHTEDIYPTKWQDSADTSSDFSIPITFSGALTYQGMISFSGQVAYSGNISHRSDSSASTRSFAFPILTSDWNTSPVKMGTPDPRYFRRQRKWHCCFCCRRPSTLFD